MSNVWKRMCFVRLVLTSEGCRIVLFCVFLSHFLFSSFSLLVRVRRLYHVFLAYRILKAHLTSKNEENFSSHCIFPPFPFANFSTVVNYSHL